MPSLRGTRFGARFFPFATEKIKGTAVVVAVSHERLTGEELPCLHIPDLALWASQLS